MKRERARAIGAPGYPREIEDVAGDWATIHEHWEAVTDASPTCGSRSGGIYVRKEYSGEGLGPVAGDFDEVALYLQNRSKLTEVGRWPLEQVAEVVEWYVDEDEPPAEVV